MTPSHLRWRLVTTACCLFVTIIALLGAFDVFDNIQELGQELGEEGKTVYYRGQLLVSPAGQHETSNRAYQVALQARYFLGTLYGVLSLFLVAYVIEDAVLLLTYKEKVPAG